MQRYFAIPLALAVLLFAAPVADAAELGSRQLRVGSHGADVLQLQRALRKLGYGIAADGDFGPKTARSIRRYERRHHMKVDGVVGAHQARQILREAAGAATGGTPPTGGGQPPEVPPVDEPPVPPASGHVFPVRGSYTFGGSGSRFGASRGGHTHQGQDMAADEGTTVVSVSNGTVHWRAYQAGGAGNYVVIRGTDGFDYAYMHFREGALVQRGDHVDAGDPIGHVGNTGGSTGPHLHFEVWEGRWQDGGHPIDPLPLLQAWAAGR